MRRFNVRLAAILAAGVVVFGIIVVFVHGYQVNRNANIFLDEARKAKEEGNLKTAAKNLFSYVRLRPDDVERQAELGLLLADLAYSQKPFSQRAFGSAFRHLEMVVRRDPSQNEARLKLVEMTMDIRRFSDAKDHLQRHLLEQSPEDGEYLMLLARCHLALQEYDKVIHTLRLVIKYAPDELPAYGMLASILRGRKDLPTEADECMKKIVENNPDSCRAHLLWASYLRNVATPNIGGSETTAVDIQKASLDLAMEQVEKALKLEPDNREALRLAAQCELSFALWEKQNAEPGEFDEKHGYDKARNYAVRAIELYPEYPELSTTLAGIELRAGNREAAIIALREGRDKVIDGIDRGVAPTSEQLSLVWGMGSLLLDSGEIEEADGVVQVLERAEYSPALVGLLAARVHYARGQWNKTLERLTEARPGLIAWPRLVAQVDYLRGRCCGHLGNTEAEIVAYQSAIRLQPFFREPRVWLAATLEKRGQLDDAIKHYQTLLGTGSPNALALLKVARVMILRNIRVRPTLRNWGQVDAILDKAAELTPESPKVVALRVESLVAQQRMDEVKTVVDEARQRDPDRPEYWAMAASIARLERNFDQAEKLLDRAEEKIGDFAAIRFARAQLLRDRYGKNASEQIRRLARNTDKFSPEKARVLRNRLLGVTLQIGDMEAVEEIANAVAKDNASDVQVRFLLLEIALRGSDIERVDAALEELHKAEGEGPLWLFGKAARLSLQAEDGNEKLLDEALEMCKRAARSRPNWSRISLLLAKIYDRRKEYDLALENYLVAIRSGEKDPNAIRRTVLLLYAKKRYKLAYELIQELSEVPPELLLVASRGAMELNQFDRALELARKGATNSVDFRNHMWLGNVLSITHGRSATSKSEEQLRKLASEAEQALREATRLAPEVPETWVATIQFLVSVKKTAEARALLDKAEETIPPDKRDVALALCYEALQLDEEAEAKYREASEATPDDAILVRHMATFYLRGGKPEEAKTQLNRIIDGKLNASKNDVVWARRQLALVLSSGRDYRATQQAIELIRKNVEEGASPEDQRLLAKIQAAMPQAADRMLAISALEDLLENQNTESPEDRFALARLYLARGNWEKFSEHMRELLVSHGDQPRYLVAYVDALLKRGLTYQARDRLRRLEAVAPNAVATYVLKARTLAQTEKYDAVIRLMREYVADNKAEPTNSESRLGQAALILEQIIAQLKTESRRDGVEEKTAVQKTNAAKKLADEAEKLYLRYTQFLRERRIVLAGFYARQSRMADAMAIIEDEWKGADPTALAQALRIMLKSPESTPDLIRRGEKVAQDSLEHHKRAFPLLIIMADVRTIHAQYAEAEGYYREILKESSGNTIVLNNLAVLLAIQGKKLDEALKLVNRAIELAGPNSSMLDSRATVYLALKKPEKALAELDRAIKEEDAPTRRLHQAQAYFQLGRKRAAANSLRIAERDGLAAQPLLVSERKTYATLKRQLP